MKRRVVVGIAALSLLGAGCAGSASPFAPVRAWLSGPVPAWELPPPPPLERPVLRDGAVVRRDLDNGLRVLVHADPRLPRVSMALTLRRGAAIEGPTEVGEAAFTANLLERGAGDRDALEFAETVDSLGASFGASADWDTLGASISGLSRDFDVLIGLLSDATLLPHFDAREAERARDETLAALERAKDDPATLARWHAARAVYGSHRFGLPVGGDAASVARLDAEQARAFHARVFVPNGAILAISGDVDPARALAAASDWFGSWPRGFVVPPGPPPPDPAPAERRIVVVDRPDLGQAQLILSHEGISRTADDRIPVSLLNTALGGGGFSSRLFTALRSEEGLTYSVFSGFALRRAPGPFAVVTFTRVDQVRRAIDVALAQLERVRSAPPDAEELAWVRTLATGRFSMGLETSEAVTQALVDLDVHGLPEDSLDTYRSRVRAVVPEQLAEAARAHLHPERAAIVLVGPAEAIRPQLDGLGPVEIVQP